jgi:hypothetical protein
MITRVLFCFCVCVERLCIASLLLTELKNNEEPLCFLSCFFSLLFFLLDNRNGLRLLLLPSCITRTETYLLHISSCKHVYTHNTHTHQQQR